MNWEALGVIGLFTVALGALLFLPARMWARRQRAMRMGGGEVRLTKIGWIYLCVAVLLLLGGLSAQYFAPESVLGQFVETPRGGFLYMAALLAVAWAAETMLKACGIELLKRD